MTTHRLHLHTAQADRFPLGRTMTSAADFTLSHPIMATHDESILVAVESVSFPSCRYAVDGSNGSIGLAGNWGDTTMTIPPKNYTATSLATALDTLFAGSPVNATLTVTFDASRGKFTFANSSANPITVKGSSTATRVLGLAQSDLIVPATGSIEAPAVVDLIPRGYHLVCEGLDVKSRDSTLNSGSTSNILVTIQNTVAFGQVLAYQSQTDDLLETNRRSVQNLDLRLLDSETMTEVNLNGAEISVVLKFVVV